MTIAPITNRPWPQFSAEGLTVAYQGHQWAITGGYRLSSGVYVDITRINADGQPSRRRTSALLSDLPESVHAVVLAALGN